MGSYTYITMPSRRPSKISWGMVSRSTRFMSPSGNTQGVVRNGLFAATLSYSKVTGGDLREIEAFQAQLDKPGNVFKLTDYSYVARGSLDGSPAVNGAGQGGYSIATKGWTANAINVLRTGDYIQIGTQMFYVTGDVSADASGLATINLATNIRNSPADGALVVVSNPTCVMEIPQGTWSANIAAPTLGALSFSCQEVPI